MEHHVLTHLLHFNDISSEIERQIYFMIKW